MLDPMEAGQLIERSSDATQFVGGEVAVEEGGHGE
jgi:hypothetical protein